MPGHKTHDRIAFITTPIVIVASAQYTTLQNAIGIGVGYLLANYYLSPDLDIDSIMNRRWGILRFIWWPYKKMFHHRSFWTHSGPISGTLRFLYLSFWLLPILFVIQPPLEIIAWLWLSMILADSVHTVADKAL